MVVVTCYNTDRNHRINIHGRNSVNIHTAKLEDLLGSILKQETLNVCYWCVCIFRKTNVHRVPMNSDINTTTYFQSRPQKKLWRELGPLCRS